MQLYVKVESIDFLWSKIDKAGTGLVFVCVCALANGRV